RVAGFPFPGGVAAPGVARHPEFDQLLIAHPAPVGFGDDVADDGDRCLEHFGSLPAGGRRPPRRAGVAAVAPLTAWGPTADVACRSAGPMVVDDAAIVDDRSGAGQGAGRVSVRCGCA